MPISVNTIRIGKKYCLINDGYSYKFTAIEWLGGDDFLFKDLMTMETYRYSELIRYGKQKDYDLFELAKA